MAASSSPSLPIRRVLLVGAHGTLGSKLLEGLVQAACFEISVLQHSNSYSSLRSPVQQVKISPEFDLDELTIACAGQDAVVPAFPLSDVSQHLRLIEAAFQSRVRRFIPADFGSCDAASPRPQHYLKLCKDKMIIREKCEELCRKAGNSNVFQSQRALILDGGENKASTSTLEILSSLERITRTKWQTEHVDSQILLASESHKLKGGHERAANEIVFILGTIEADWTSRDGYAKESLGLEDEELDDVVAMVVAEHGGKRTL